MPQGEGPDDDWGYTSCGTWSLVGTLVSTPLNSPSVREDNFTNLGAVGGMTCFHKSINRMWILKQCMDHWADDGEPWDIVELLNAADLEQTPVDLLLVDDPILLGIGDMPSRINIQRTAKGLNSMSEHRDDAPKDRQSVVAQCGGALRASHSANRYHTGKDLRRPERHAAGSHPSAPVSRSSSARPEARRLEILRCSVR